MPLPTAYVLALMPSSTRISLGMGGNFVAPLAMMINSRLSAMTKVKISSWKRDMLAPYSGLPCASVPFGSLSSRERSISPAAMYSSTMRP